MNDFLRNYLLGVSLAIPLGPASLIVIQTGLRAGFLRAWLTGIGVTLADTTFLLVVYFGISGFMGIPAVKLMVWMLGALVLFYLGWQSLRTVSGGSQKLKLADETTTASTPRNAGRNPLLVGYLVNIANPIAVVFLGRHLRIVDRRGSRGGRR